MIRKITFLAITLILVGKSYAAIDEKEYAKCTIVEGDLARLECFDNLAALLRFVE